MSKFLGIAPQFVVPDVVKTAEYYRDVLGFEIRGYWLEPPVYAIVARNAIELHFGKGDSSVPSGNTDRRKGSIDAYIYVTGVDDLFTEFRKRNVDLLTANGPENRLYGQREIVVRDLNGFVIAFGENIEK